MKFATAVVLFAGLALAEDDVAPSLVERCTPSESTNTENTGRVLTCSSVSVCSDGAGTLTNSHCIPTESCGQWKIGELQKTGCILSDYCGLTDAEWDGKATTFTCPLGKNKGATKLAATLAAAIAAIALM